MRGVLKLILAILVAVILLFAVRTFLFTIYTVPNTIPNTVLKSGDRVMVNRLNHVNMQRGDLIVFGDSTLFIGRVEALPGDTIKLKGEKYVIPPLCCHHCVSDQCRPYLVNLGNTRTIVRQKFIKGKAYRLFNFRIWQ
jgi:signal peptidase I